RRRILPVEEVIPAQNRGLDEAADEIRLLLDEIAARLDQGRIGVEAVIGQQEDLRLEAAMLLDRIWFRGDVTLHRRVLVGQERLRVERVGLHLGFAESELGLHPLEIGSDALLGDEQGQLLKVLEFLHARVGMRDQDLRVLLEHRRDRDRRDLLATASNACSRLALMKKSILPTGSRMRLLTCGPPGTIVTSRPYCR